jgi:hypothetical protein
MSETESVNFDEYMPTKDAADKLDVSESRLRQIASEKGYKPRKRYGINWWSREWVEQVSRERAGKEGRGGING